MTESQSFGKRLRIARRAAGLSITEAASLLNRTPRLWKYWEADERTPPSEAKQITQEKLFKTLARVQEINKTNK